MVYSILRFVQLIGRERVWPGFELRDRGASSIDGSRSTPIGKAEKSK